MIPKVVICSCVYGHSFPPFILSFLESWLSYSAKIILLTHELPKGVLEELKETYPQVDFVSESINLNKSHAKRIAQKMYYWKILAQLASSEALDYAIFADIDTIAVQDPRSLCRGDITITLRSADSQYILNSGILSLSKRALSSSFIDQWEKETSRVVSIPSLLRTALSPDDIYGAPDQMALANVLGITKDCKEGCFPSLSVSSAPCSIYNACENNLNPSLAKVIHLKSSLQAFLIKRKPLIGDRKTKDSLYQIKAAINANTKGINRLRVSSCRKQSIYQFKMPIFIRRDMSSPPVVLILYRCIYYARVCASWLRSIIYKV